MEEVFLGIEPQVFAKYIDHTILRPDATVVDIERACKESEKYGFATCVVPPCYVKLASSLLKNSETKVCTVIGFPLGFEESDIKLHAAEKAIENGAQELDVVMNISAFKSKNYDAVSQEISRIARLAHENDVLVKVIIETALLSEEEICTAAKLVAESGADYVKTNTGIIGKVSPRDVYLIRKAVGNKAKVKAAGGIRHFIEAAILISMGADRIGTSSGVQIYREFLQYRVRAGGSV